VPLELCVTLTFPSVATFSSICAGAATRTGREIEDATDPNDKVAARECERTDLL
jgi:hypothetical protein